MATLPVSRLLLTLGGIAVFSGSALSATTWTGAAGNSLWTDAANWANGVPSRTVTDTAIFDDGSAAGGTVALGTGSNFRPKNTNWQFLSGAKGYTFTGADFIDNQSNTRTFTTDAGVTQDQSFASPVRIANHTITIGGSGHLAFSRFYNEHAWADTTFNTGAWAVNHADAVLSIGRFDQARGYTFTKSGAGKVVIGGVIDFPYGMNGTTFVATRINVNAGTVDLSAATINLESNMGTGESLAADTAYTLVNYANGTLVGGGSFATTGAPTGWEVVDDPAGKKIVLRMKPALPTRTVVLVR